jgi:hypothetical protein
MKTIRASEIGTFVYCQRAWHYLQLGYESENRAELAGGSELHYRHGRTVMASGCLRSLAYALLLIALALLAVYAVGKLG